MKATVTQFLIALLLVISLQSKGQVTHRDLLQKFFQTYEGSPGSLNPVPQNQFHPFPQSPEGWKKILPDSISTMLVKKGEAALKKDFKNIPATVMLEFVRNGNRTDYERLSFEKRNQLWDLMMAESIEGKGRFVDQIVNGIWSISEESFWGISAHVGAQKAGAGLPDVEDPIVDLFAAETASVMAWTDYFVGPQLEKASKLIRPRIRYEITRRILTPMETAKYGWMGGGKPDAKLNNWAPWIASNYLTAFLLIEKNDTKRAEDMNRTIKIVDQYLNGLGVDGGCDEGPSYWTAAGGCVYDVLNLLHDANNKLNYYHNPFIQKMGSYIYKTHIAGKYFINVADAHPTLTPNGLMLYRFGKDMDDKQMMAFGSWAFHAFPDENTNYEQFHRTRGLYNLSAINSCASYPAKEDDVKDAWYSDVQLMASRSNNGLFLSAHGGNNGESHNHNDVGDFTVYANGLPVIIDVGSGTYTARTFGKDRYKLWFNTSPYHNLPVINGKEQGSTGAYEATDVVYNQNKNITTLSMNIAKAYPADAGIKTWLRTVKMDKAKGIEVSDVYEIANLTNLTQSFMSVCDINLDSPGKITFTLPDNSKVYLDYDASVWTAGKEKMELTSPEDQGLKHSWEGKTIWRILLTGKGGKASGSFKYSINK
jgi:hypothetical protein